MRNPNLLEMRQLIPTLELIPFRAWSNRYARGAFQEDPLSTKQCLQFYLVDWIMHLGIVTDGQCRDILTRLDVHNDLTDLARALETAREVQPFTLTIAESAFVTWTGAPGWYNYTTDEEELCLVDTPVTLLSCNVIGLLLRMERWLLKLRGNTDAPNRLVDRLNANAKGPPG